MSRVGGIDKDKIDLVGQLWRKRSGIDAENVFAGGMDVVAEGLAIQIAGHIQRSAAAGAGIDDQIALLRITHEKIPDDVARRRSAVIRIALHIIAVMLRGIVPEGGGLDAKARLSKFHVWRLTTALAQGESRDADSATCL